MLRDALAGVRALGYDRALGIHQPAQEHLRASRRELAIRFGSIGYRVRVSGAAVNLPRVPWIAVLNPEVTTTAQAGLYVVYLFSEDLSEVFLSVNQGATAHRQYWRERNPEGRSASSMAIQELAEEAATIRESLPASLLSGTNDSVVLRSEGFLPSGYEAGNIASIRYDVASLPAEDTLERDLQTVLSLYDSAVSVREQLTVTDPERFHTPALAGAARDATSTLELFRPKSSESYIAEVAAHAQVRTRRHEAVVKSFGLHCKSRGWRALTSVHPRDVVLRRDRQEILCEVKVVGANAEFAVREVVGQLFTYRYFLYPNTRPDMIGVFSDEVGEAFVELLLELGIESAWLGRDGVWCGSRNLEAWGLV